MWVFLFVSAAAFAQYGTIMDQAAAQGTLSVGVCIRLLGVCAGSIAPELGAADARTSLARLGIRLPRTPDSDPITYGEFAYLLTQLYDRPGSFSLRLLAGPRTSFRDLQDRGLIPPAARAGFTISGADALLLQRRFLESMKALP